MLDTLLFLLVVIPLLAALGIYVLRIESLRMVMVLVTAALLTGASLALFSFETITYSTTLLGINPGPLITILKYAILFIFLGIGISARHRLIIYLSAGQLILLAILKLVSPVPDLGQALFMIDPLAKLMVAVVSIVGSIIILHALPYMKNHEEHLHLPCSRQPQFFALMVLLLGAMNGLVLTNSLLDFYFFFKVTTLCSFLLIRHDLTDESKRNALRALWMNNLGGLALLTGVFWIALDLGTLNIQQVLIAAPEAALLPIGLLCLAGLIRAAQLPFQGWLLGAMVAPTPSSALFSVAMAKVGVYLILRLSPAYAETFFSATVALVGAFTFLAAAALAISQSNGKKILEYSTVSNLGLIITCVGINTPTAITAAMFLIIFHAVNKALLSLCVGTIKQHISSRDIEDMRGLYGVMPVTALITVLGSLTMILPPFGMLLGKWMAIGASADNVLLVVILALGSALTVLYWARWAGLLISYPRSGKITTESQPVLTRFPLLGLTAGVLLLSFYAPWIYNTLISQGVALLSVAPPEAMPLTAWGILILDRGNFPVIPLFLVGAVGVLVALYFFKTADRIQSSGPYLSGAQIPDDQNSYTGPILASIKPSTSNYYLEKIFGEKVLNRYVNTAALVLILLMLGGGL